MAKTKTQKKDLVAEYEADITASKGILFTDNPGLKVNEVTSLRKELAGVGAKFHLLKNKLFQRAAKDKVTMDEAMFDGTLAAIFATGDPTQAAKKLKEFSKGLTKQPSIKGGVLDGKNISVAEAISLANLPSKEELLAKTLYMFNAPLTGFARVLNGNTQNLVYGLNALIEKKNIQKV